ncbi:MAG: LamG-like jellyroll fold domain-containing protein [Candidatus Paceibacterota bacterium]
MQRIKINAFTLIELLVVIAIIGILSALIVVGMSSTTQKATIAKAQVFSHSMDNSLLLNRISQWKIDEASGTAANDFWSISNGVLVNFTDTTAGYGDSHNFGWMSGPYCVSGSCLKYDGVGNLYINCGDVSRIETATALTLSAWIKIGTLGTQKTIFNKGYLYSTNNGIDLRVNASNQPYIFIGNGTKIASAVSNDTVNTTLFSMVAMVWDGATVRMYVNGVLQPSTDTLIGPLTFEASKNVRIGLGGYLYTGLIDDVRVYDAAIPTSQIKQNYLTGLNRLLVNNQINNQEYSKRLAKLSNNYAKQ